MKCSNRVCRLAERQVLPRAIQQRPFSSSPLLSSSSAPKPNETPAQPPHNKVIFSGIQPTGVPHLGNYLGALQQWKRMQDTASPDTKLIFSIVDLHAITVPRPRGLLTRYKREMLAALLAIGLNPSRCTIFHQSSVPAHSELQWILSCTASTGYLSRMTQWKSKLSSSSSSSPPAAAATITTNNPALKHGLFSYPVLQAADILVHRATHVPVGDDQRQHLEFARECATNFNHAYAVSHLLQPETILSPARRVMSLRNPRAKMSKSDADPRSRVLFTDSKEEVTKKIMGAVTDSINGVSYDPEGRPGVANLLEMLVYLGVEGEGVGAEEIAEGMRGVELKVLKGRVAEAVNGELDGIRERWKEVMSKGEGYLEGVAEEGRVKAAESAEGTMRLVREAVELGP